MKLLSAFLLLYCWSAIYAYTNPCNNHPCHNHGKCVPDQHKRAGVYSCNCQDNFGGRWCEQKLRCAPNVCGINENCVVRGSKVFCVCKPGNNGNSVTGCNVGTRQACFHGDPHYDTFDGFKGSYHGTCPFIAIQNRYKISNFPDFKLVVNSNTAGNNAKVSWVSDFELTIYGQRIYLVKWNSQFYFNGERTSAPFYWPNEKNQKIRINHNGVIWTVETQHNVHIHFTNSYGCIRLPATPVLRGQNTLMGVIGNIDGDWRNDMICKDGRRININSYTDYFKPYTEDFIRCQDSYITTFHDANNHTACMTGLTLAKQRTNCNNYNANKQCSPIKMAATGTGIFGKCKVLGATRLNDEHQDCVLAMCASESNKCNIFSQFTATCQRALPAGTSVGAWRSNSSCPLFCPANSYYSGCASPCPRTCANVGEPEACKNECLEECVCEPGYVRDNTVTSYTKCIRVEECGCKGPQGNWHQARQSFLNNQCNLYSGCYGGKYVSKATQCSKDATCTVKNGIRQCLCRSPYVGDGYTCGIRDNIGKVIVPVSPQCNICASYPCRNGGKCILDMTDPCHKYKCACVNPYANDNCTTFLKCNINSCSANAECKVENSQLTCTCKKGYDGDPYKRGCVQYKKSCIRQNKIWTLGGIYTLMTGTCPILMLRNKEKIQHHEDIQVIVKQGLSKYNRSHTSLSDVEMIIDKQAIHIENENKIRFNGAAVLPPFYWPSEQDWKIQISKSYWRIIIDVRHSYKIEYQPGYFCVGVPSGPDFNGKRVFEGVGGNIGFNYTSDLVCRDGTVFPAPAYNLYSKLTTDESVRKGAAKCVDSWKEEMKTKKMNGKCIDGEKIIEQDKNTKCTVHALKQHHSVCKPMQDAINGTGIFAKCKAMESVDIKNFYDDCLMGMCLNKNSKCELFSSFASACAEAIKHSPGVWRASVACPQPVCGALQEYKDCASQCQDTCAKRHNNKCDKGCREGCVCQNGYLIDNTVTEKVVCIKEEACGCTDQMGKWYHGNSTWVSNECRSINSCQNGILRVTRNECGKDATCEKTKSSQTCKCNEGYMGDGYNCKPLREHITDPQPTKVGEHDICATVPCKNGGTCIRDLNNPGTKFSCKCPTNFGGSICDDLLECKLGTCGENAECTVMNNKVDCVCKKGYAGNPMKSCGRVRSACISQDPHMVTFDGLEADYHGTCPYLFTSSCGKSIDGYTPFQVVLKNQLSDSEEERYLSWVYEAEIELFNQTLHIDMETQTLTVNKIKQNAPFYWPQEKKAKISVVYRGRTFRITTEDGIEFTFGNYKFCANLPDVPAFKKTDSLCGIAGNMDDKWQNDVVCKNKDVLKLSKKSYYFDFSYTELQKCQDTWITSMKTVKGDHNKCQTAETLGKLYGNNSCDVKVPTTLCQPIKLAAQGKGPFAKCKAMGKHSINTFFQDCIVEVCPNKAHLCRELQAFASACSEKLPQDTDLGDWRSSCGCSLRCPSNSVYSTCKSACPETCAEQGKTVCDKGCIEGCACLPGFVLDNTVSDKIKCFKKEDCGCTDMNGNWHRASNPFLTNNCQFINQCDNGTLVEKSHSCGKHSLCVIADSKMQCSCKYGFAGDGYNCNEITQTDEKKGVPSTCYPGWKYFKVTNKCYKNFNDRKITSVEGKDICARNSAMPVSINILEEHKFIIDEFAHSSAESSVSWIGLVGSSGNYKWIDGMGAEPKWNKYATKKKDCGQLILSDSGDVVDSECGAQASGVICEAFPIVSNVCES